MYRHLRRRENDRQAFIQNCAGKEIKDIEFQEKLMANKLAADQRTSKKRAKRYAIFCVGNSLMVCGGGGGGGGGYYKQFE